MNFITESLIVAAREGNLPQVKNLVQTQNHNVNTVSSKYKVTPLHAASLHGHTEVARFLVQNGANTELADDWNCTALHNAAGNGHYQIVDLLCEAGARLDARASNKGKTPIEIARDKGKFDVVSLLQEHIRKRSRSKLPNNVAPEPRIMKGNFNYEMQFQDPQPTHHPVNNQQQPRMPPIELAPRYGPNSSAIKSEKFHLMKQLRQIERKEAIQDLNKEGRKLSEQLRDAAKNYQGDIDELKDQIQDLKSKLGTLENQRNKEIVTLENKLRGIGKRIHELEVEEVSSPEI